MVDRLLEKTAPAVQFEAPAARTKGERTRARILDIAYDSIVHKGFAATSIDELVEAAGITKSGFFYHFKDKNDLARQLLERFLAEDNQILDTLTERVARAGRRSAAELPDLPEALCRRDGRHARAPSRLPGRDHHLPGPDVRRARCGR